MKKYWWILLFFVPLVFIWRPGGEKISLQAGKGQWWEVQSVDTMKYSRDLARTKASDIDFNKTIDLQVGNIASVGATHVAIATPYDEEFIPFLKRWVDSARRSNLKVWFRGNFSGWEGWFNYEKITREQHLEKTKKFIEDHPNLFADGDVFSSCPECENGGPGDPRHNGDVEGHRKFLIAEYKIAQAAFDRIGKKVHPNFHSMNGDVAKIIMDKDTTEQLGGLVVIDHYVDTPQKLADDIETLAKVSGGKVFLGEFGAPIPDIHGKLDEASQAKWLEEALGLLTKSENLAGLNYWVGIGGTTQIFNDDGSERLAAGVVKNYFLPKTITGIIKNDLGQNLSGATVSSIQKTVWSDNAGHFVLPYRKQVLSVSVSAENHVTKISQITSDGLLEEILVKKNKNLVEMAVSFFRRLGFASG